MGWFFFQVLFIRRTVFACVCAQLGKGIEGRRRERKKGKEEGRGTPRGHIPLGLALGEVDHACHGRGVRWDSTPPLETDARLVQQGANISRQPFCNV
eukprot:scaffold867_cov317-Pavlova_lutheri.AAC.73